MLYLSAELLLMLLLILLASQLFTNSLEYLSQHAGWSAGMTGSIFAAVATALPETSVPVLALIAGTNDPELNQEIGVGAILGAPLMISTLSIALMAVFAIKGRGLGAVLKPEKTGLIRDLNFFIAAFILAAAALFVPSPYWGLRPIISVCLVLLYLVYLRQTWCMSKQLVQEGHGVIPDEPLLFSRLGFKNHRGTMLMQLLIGLLLLLGGAKGFIEGVEGVSQALGVSALLISLLIVPIATELPEKVNSILWVRKNKDTLALGNLTGALVFQGTLLPALGVWLDTWQADREILAGVLMTLVAAIWLRLNVSARGLPLAALILNGALYGCYLCLVL